MSQRDNFSGGFVLGAIFGGIVGGILGAVVASRQISNSSEEALLSGDRADRREGRKKSQLKGLNEQNIEVARRSLEDKIAQLNEAIDEVRQQLGPVNGAVHLEGEEPPVLREP